MQRVVFFCAIFLLFLILFIPEAQTKDPPVLFRSVATQGRGGRVSPFIIHGTRPANTAEWVSTLTTTLPGAAGVESCTATIVGPRTILTAAHCLRYATSMKFNANGKSYNATCAGAEKYTIDRNADADYALCFATDPVQGVPYQTLSTDPGELRSVTMLTLAGYGCISDPDRLYDGFNIGPAAIEKWPGDLLLTPNAVVVRGGAAVCLGDSGGGAYIQRSGASRVLVAINAKLNSELDNGPLSSTLRSVSTPDAKAFFKGWLDDPAHRGAAICGYSPNVMGCK
jgi:hypothetical protein